MLSSFLSGLFFFNYAVCLVLLNSLIFHPLWLVKNCLYVYYLVNRGRPAASVLCKYLDIISYPMFERPLLYSSFVSKAQKTQKSFLFYIKAGSG